MLEHLSLDACDDVTDDGLRALSRLSLRALSLDRAGGITAQGIGRLRGHPLEHLRLTWTGAVSGDPSCLAGLTSLRSLHLDQAHAGDTVLDGLRRLRLQRLVLGGASVTADGLAALKGMPLADLSLRGATDLDPGAALRVLQGLPLKKLALSDQRGFDDTVLSQLAGFALESLDLSLNPVGPDGLRHLAGLPLVSLDLGFCDGVDGEALRVLAGLGLPLAHLDLSGLALRDEDLVHLRGLPLRHLVLQDSPWLTDAGVAHLAGLPLAHLVIGAGPGESKLTAAAVPVLAELPLETLWLPNASGIGTEGWSRLAALPARVTGPGL